MVFVWRGFSISDRGWSDEDWSQSIAKHTYIHHTYIHTDRQTDRQTSRQTDRQPDRNTYIYIYIYTYIHTYILSNLGNFKPIFPGLEAPINRDIETTSKIKTLRHQRLNPNHFSAKHASSFLGWKRRRFVNQNPKPWRPFKKVRIRTLNHGDQLRKWESEL